jgi:phosphoribosylformimino-5-aminoimidazole carboxamide ribotide isomerase
MLREVAVRRMTEESKECLMILLPAIDILGGQAVRLAKGDYNAVTLYNVYPVGQACIFLEQGAEWIHVVDLDGARTGEPVNAPYIEQIIKETGLKVEVGGGIRTLESIERFAKAGASRIVIGTKLITDPNFAKSAVATYGDLICAGVDTHDGEVAIEGWREGSGVAATELVAELKSWGIHHLVYTDIARDGMQTGIDPHAYETIAKQAGFPVIASGGISTLDDLKVLQSLGDDVVEGAIAGRAIYENNFSVEEAIALLRDGESC